MLKCEECGLIKWREVWKIRDKDAEYKIVQCDNCKRVVVTDTLEGEGRI